MTVKEPGKVIDEVWLFVAVDETGDEGIVGMHTTLGWMPFVAADERRRDDLRPLAQSVAWETGRPVQVRHLTNWVDVEVLEP